MNNQPTQQPINEYQKYKYWSIILGVILIAIISYGFITEIYNQKVNSIKLEAENSTILSIAQGQAMSGNFLVFNYQTNQTEVWTYNELCNIKAGGNGQ